MWNGKDKTYSIILTVLEFGLAVSVYLQEFLELLSVFPWFPASAFLLFYAFLW